MDACHTAGKPKPDWRNEYAELWVGFRFSVSKKAPVETPVKARAETPVKTPARILAFLQMSSGASLAEVAVATCSA